jgi:hypothetical protein
MVSDESSAPRGPLLLPRGMFVLHLRSDSAPADRHLVGRVEHVQSGDSEPFTSLTALLGFIDRHVAPRTTQP